jgi:two-component system KDP operon response regulator KdpE
VILDLIMPFQDGWETCRKIRLHSNIPVIILTSLSSDREIIRGLETGADDFVSKPINIQVLLARAGAVLRRMKAEPQEEPSAIFEDDHLMIDLEKRLILLDGVKVNLTPTEFRLLEYLLTHCGDVLTFAEILEHVWGEAYLDSPNYVHVYISHLRQKLEPDPNHAKYFFTEYGIGYRFLQPKSTV